MSQPALSAHPSHDVAELSTQSAAPRVEVSEFPDDQPTDHSSRQPRVQRREQSDDDPTDLGGRDQAIAFEPEELVVMREEVVRLRRALIQTANEIEAGLNEIAHAHDIRRKAEDDTLLMKRRAEAAEDRTRTLELRLTALHAYAQSSWYNRLFGRPALPEAT